MKKSIVILFSLFFIIFCANAMLHSMRQTSKNRAHHLPTILFCADNKYHSHLQLSIEMANILGSSGKYKVHFLVADHRKKNDDGLNPYESLNTKNGAITLINVPIDQKYLDKVFANIVEQTTFRNLKKEVTIFEKPDFVARFTIKTIALYQAISINPNVLVDGEEHKILDFLRQRQHSAHPYALGIAEYGVSASAFPLFEELGIHNFVANSATSLLPALYHFIGIPIPLKIPEFFSAEPREKYKEMGIKWEEINKERYEISINKIKEILYEENIKIYQKIRKEAKKKEIILKETSPLGDIPRRCHSLLINQPSSLFNFDMPDPTEKLKYIGGIATKYLKLYSKKFANKKSSRREKNQRDPLLVEVEKKQWKKKAKCVVIFSLGTIVNFQGISDQAIKNMFQAFKKESKCQFLVHFDKELTKNLQLPSNVQIFDFHKGLIAQQEILAQNNVRAFISHCGQNSLNEAVFAGVPLICIPFFYDQPFNAAVIEHLGIGIWVKPEEFADKFPEALHQILHNRKYSQKMKEIAKELHANQNPQKLFLDSIAEAIEQPHKEEHVKSGLVNDLTDLGPIKFIYN